MERAGSKAELPRLGVRFMHEPGLEYLEWFGRGPFENYCDRKRAAWVDRFQSTVTDQYVPYILSQEHGNHCDVRWLTVRDSSGLGVRIYSESVFEFSASHYTAEDLFSAGHTCDLTPRKETILNPDFRQRGLGMRVATRMCWNVIEFYRAFTVGGSMYYP